jgi:hypothetical protein
MSAYLMGRAFYTDLPAHLRFLLVALCDHAHDDGTSIKVGQSRLARKTGAAERTVRANLAELRSLGYIERLKRQSSAGVDQYRIVLSMLPTHKDIDDRPADVAGASDQANRRSTAGPTGSPLPPNHKEPSEKDLASREEKARPRDELFEAVMEVSGVDLSEIPETARGKYNAAVSGLRVLGATPDEVRRRAGLAWFTLTPNALYRHWAELRGGRRRAEKKLAEPCDECGGREQHRAWCSRQPASAASVQGQVIS